MKGDPACKSEMTAIRSPFRFAGQDGNVIRVSRRTSREGSTTNAHMARKARQQSNATKMILARKRRFLFSGCSGAESACSEFNNERPYSLFDLNIQVESTTGRPGITGKSKINIPVFPGRPVVCYS
jgi:hypothetical protein